MKKTKMPLVGLPKNNDARNENKETAKRKPQAAESESPQPLQQMYGNAMLRRAAQSGAGKDRTPIPALGYKYERYIRWLQLQAAADGRRELMRRFHALTAPQKQAALLAAVGMDALDKGSFAVHWEQLENRIEKVEDVNLRRDEPEKEADASEQGARAPQGSVDVTGLLAPYKEIVLWLNYKANKQGEAPLLQKFALLSIPRKKLAIHKMMGFKKLTVEKFAKELTLPIMQREWVNWKSLRDAIEEAASPELEEQAIALALTEAGDGAGKEEAEDESGFGLPAALLALLGLTGDDSKAEDKGASSEKEKQETSAEQAPKSGEAGKAFLLSQGADFWGRLLLGLAGETLAVVMTRFIQGKPDKEQVVDRYLSLDRLSPDKRRKQRANKLKAAGFRSVEECHRFIATAIASVLHRQAFVLREESFMPLMKLLDVPPGQGEAATTAQIIKKLV